MSSINMSELRAEQDRTDSRRQQLSERFTAFREGLLGRLEQLTAEAAETGLRGVQSLERTYESGQLLEVTLSLNDMPLLLVVPAKAQYLQGEREDILAFRVFVFFSTDTDNAYPLLDIVCGECGGDSGCYEIRVLPSEEGWKLRKSGRLTEEGSQEAAEYLVDFLYQMRPAWRPEPKLRQLRSGRTVSRPIGFRTGRANE